MTSGYWLQTHSVGADDVDLVTPSVGRLIDVETATSAIRRLYDVRTPVTAMRRSYDVYTVASAIRRFYDVMRRWPINYTDGRHSPDFVYRAHIA